jgi:hypothetical protein
MGRTITVFIVLILFIGIEFYSGVAPSSLVGLPTWAWTIFAFIVILLISMLGLVIFRLSNSYILRQDTLEIRHGLVRLNSFIVTPNGFGDLLVYQSFGGRIFGYGDLTVNSQGERQTKLRLVREPFKVAASIRDVMGKPIVRVEGHV